MLAGVMIAVMLTTGCASAGRAPVTAVPQASVVDTKTMADYVRRLPAGSKVRIERRDGTTLRGTLMNASDETIVVQRNTRIPEAPINVPLQDLTRVTLDTTGMSTGKAVAIGIASGVGTFFAILALAFAISGD
jgi:hypothetical protein